jgi:hypothetical protein
VAIAVWAGRVLLAHEQPTEMLSHKKKTFYERFIVEMNHRAVELGMIKTNYVNSHGLMNSLNRSCAYDLAILCEHGMNNTKFREIVGCKSYASTIAYNPNLNYQSLVKRVGKDRYRDDEVESGEEKDLDSSEEEVPEKPHREASAFRTVEWENTHRLLQQKQK